MIQPYTFLKFFLTLCITLSVAVLAQAQATRTWVSGVGDDVNPCSRTAPCKTFAGAISKTFINGEIDALDPGGFGTLTITKSITLDGSGTFASILASGTNGININIALNANDPLRNVRIRGLSINGSGASGAVGTRTGIQGINITVNGANNVWIEDCVVFDFSQNGLNLSNTSSTTNVFIKNSVFRDNGGAGVLATSNNGSFFARVAADNSHFTGNLNGIQGGGNSRIEADNCTLSGNGNAGVLAKSTTAGLVAVVNVSSSQLSNNLSFGAQAGGAGAVATSIVRLGRNIVTGSAIAGVNIGTNGEIDTYGDNHIFGNNIDGCPGCTAIVAPNS